MRRKAVDEPAKVVCRRHIGKYTLGPVGPETAAQPGVLLERRALGQIITASLRPLFSLCRVFLRYICPTHLLALYSFPLYG